MEEYRRPRRFSRQAGEFSKAFHFRARGHGAVLLHHGAHLHILLQDLVDVLHGGAAAFCDPFAALAVDDVVVLAFLIGHGVDDGFDLFQFAFVHAGVFGNILQRADFGEHVHQLIERAHFANLAKLVAKIFQRKSFRAKFAFEIKRGFLVHGLLGAFDERHDVAHAEDSRDDSFWIETFEGIVFFAESDKLYRRTADFADGERCSAACVAIEFGENDAGESEALVKFSGGAYRVLSDHGVSDKENFAGLQFFFQIAEFVHQVVVNVQAAGGVHDNDITGGKFRFLDGAANNFQWLVGSGARPETYADGFCNLRELFPRGGTVDVCGNDDRTVAMLRQPSCKFASGGRFAGALQADNHPHGWWARGKERLGVFAEQRSELIANQLDDLLVGRELQHDFAAERFAANAGEKFVDDRESDVAFEHGFADFGECGIEVLFGEFALATEILEGALQLFCEVFKHGKEFSVNSGP